MLPTPLLVRRVVTLLVLLIAPALHAQVNRTLIEVSVTPDHPGWVYKPGEKARFNVAVLRAGYPVEGAAVRYEVGPEMMDPAASGPLQLKEGRATIDGGTLREPGFIRMQVIVDYQGKEYRGAGTAGFSPESIQPTAVLPDDFMAFWEQAIQQAREVPLDAKMTLLPEYSTVDVNVYHVSFQNDRRGGRIYGMLSMPAAPGRYPMVLQVPGAGVRPYSPNVGVAQRGVIHLAIGIHGIPVNLDPQVYRDLAGGAVASYWTFGLDRRDAYYYKRVILGAVRAGDFLNSLPEADGSHYGVYGGSQGGALSIITAALDPRITRLSAIHPAMADHEGYLHGRAGGWPHLFAPRNHQNTPEKVETARYYDVVNFARHLRVPGYYTWGFNDNVCPPTSMYAAYNVIEAPKQLVVLHETAHWTYPEQWEAALDHLIEGFTP
ncbi:MAG: acetylxylan esterase [Rhodothermales bacterium]